MIAWIVTGFAAWGTALVPWAAAGSFRAGRNLLAILVASLVAGLLAATSQGAAFLPTVAIFSGCSLALLGAARLLRSVGCCPMATTLSLGLTWWLLLASPFLAAPLVSAPDVSLPSQAVTTWIAALHPVGVLLDSGWSLDWFRADHLYDASPLGSHYFRYPSWRAYVGVALTSGAVAIALAYGVDKLRASRSTD